MAKVQHTCTGCVPIDASIIDVYVTLVQTNQFVTDAETGRALAEAARVTAENARTATFSEDHSRAVADHTNAQTAINNANAAAAAANAAGITSASASVDSNVGTPSVDVSLVNKQLSLSFHNIKGEKGEKGDRGDGAIPVVNDLVTGGTAAALSAEMGKTLNTTKQATLVSGTNIKTVNGESLLGEGNIVAGDPNAVKYVAQTLTDAQKAQARTNIDAYQKPSTGIPATDLASAAQTSLGKADTAYQKPAGGIPKTDLDSGVQGSLDLADSAIQARPMGEVDPTITPADYATTEELSELEAEVDDLTKVAEAIDLATIAEWTNGGCIVGRSDANPIGTVLDSSSYAYSNYLPVNPGDTLVFTNIKKALPASIAGSCFYDISKVAVQGIGCELNASADGYVQKTVIVPEGAYFIRFSKFSDDSIGTFEATNNTTDGVIPTMQESITQTEKSVYNKIPFSSEIGSINSDTGVEVPATAFYRTEFIDVSTAQGIIYTRVKTTGSPVGGCVFYDSSKNYVSGTPFILGASENGYEIEKLSLPSDAYYVRFVYWLSKNPGVFFFAQERDATAYALYEGKNIVPSLQDAGMRINVSSSGDTAAKTGTTGSGWKIAGAPSMFVALMQEENTADNVTLNINNTGAYPLYYNGAVMSSQNKPNGANAQLLIVKASSLGSYVYVSFLLPRVFDGTGDSEVGTMTQKSITSALQNVGCLVKPIEGSNSLNFYVAELYLVGLDASKRYYVSSLSYKNSEHLTNSLVVKEQGNDTIVARFYDEQAVSGVEPSMLVALVQQNASGISGYAVVDWKKLSAGDLVTNPDKDLLIPEVAELDFWPILAEHLKTEGILNKLTFVEDDGVIATAWNYVLKDVTIGGTRYIQFSNNLGKSFTQAENTFGDIVYVHFFSNGVCLFATANKCYYFSDIADIRESSLVDYDGTPYTSDCVLDFFQNDQSRNEAMIVDGKEIVVWGNYSLAYSYDPNYVGRVWYSDDYGATVKCAIKFGTTPISGQAIGVRHVHGALYNPYNEKFIIITGDYGDECQIIEGVYNSSMDSWSFTMLGKGDEFKFGDVLFREKFVYLITDYTVDTLARGVLRCPYKMLNDYTKYEYICKITNYSGSLISMLEDENGNKLLFPDGAGRGKMWYCKHDFDFKEVPLSEDVVITNISSPNYNGEIYARKSQGAASFPFKLKPMVNLTKSMRDSGCVDFFVQDNVLL